MNAKVGRLSAEMLEYENDSPNDTNPQPSSKKNIQKHLNYFKI